MARVLWIGKASARSDDLHVKEFNSLDQHSVEVVFDRHTPVGQEAEFEAAVDRCATLLHNLWERGIEVLFRCEDFERAIAPGSDRVYGPMHFLATVEPDFDSTSRRHLETETLVIGVNQPTSSRQPVGNTI